MVKTEEKWRLDWVDHGSKTWEAATPRKQCLSSRTHFSRERKRPERPFKRKLPDLWVLSLHQKKILWYQYLPSSHWRDMPVMERSTTNQSVIILLIFRKRKILIDQRLLLRIYLDITFFSSHWDDLWPKIIGSWITTPK